MGEPKLFWKEKRSKGPEGGTGLIHSCRKRLLEIIATEVASTSYLNTVAITLYI